MASGDEDLNRGLAQVRAENTRLRSQLHRSAATVADLRARLDASAAENAALRTTLAEMKDKMEVMNFRVAQMSRRIFGNLSESHHPDQQTIEQIMQSLCGVGAGQPAQPLIPDVVATTGASAAAKPGRKNKKRGGRLVLPDHLPMEDRRLETPEAERLGLDGRPLPLLREEISWKLDYKPPTFLRIRLIRCIYGLPFSDQPSIATAPLRCVVPHGLPTDALVAQVLVDKYDLHCPLYRQETKLERLGVDLSRATLMTWVRCGATALAPIHAAMCDHLRRQPVIHLDDTWIDVLDPGKGTTHESRLWGYLGGDEFVCEYRRSRGGKWPLEFLADYRGTVMADAYAGHHRLFTDGRITSAGCMAHARRKFTEAEKLGERTANQALDLFSVLYVLEDELRERPPDERLRRRQAAAVPVLDRLERLLRGWVVTSRPQSRLRIAATYTLKIFPTLRHYTTDERVPIDNNPLERCWRPVGLNRKNSLFVGSDRGGAWAATLFSICQSCRLVGIDPYRYLCDVFAQLHTGRTDYDAMRPVAWAQQRVAKTA